MADGVQVTQRRSHHSWTATEDQVLVDCLLESWQAWKGDNGFRPGLFSHLEKLIHERIPGCSIKGNPHIISRIKQLKKNYNAINEMMGATGSGSGFGWDDKLKMIVVEKSIYDNWVKSHPNAKGLFMKPFPHYEALGTIFGKDVATGKSAHGAEDVVEDLDRQSTMLDETPTNGDEYFNLMGDISQTQDYTPIIDPEPEEVVEPPPVSTSTAKKGKKRVRSEDEDVGVVAEVMKDLTQTYKKSTNNIEKMVSSFNHQPDGANKRMSVIQELQKFEYLTEIQRVQLAMIMGKDSYLMDIFREGSDETRRVLVTSLLA